MWRRQLHKRADNCKPLVQRTYSQLTTNPLITETSCMVSDTPFTWMMVHVITHLPSPSNASSPHREHERNGTHAVEMGDIEKCLKTDGRTIYRDTANVLRLSVKTNLTKIMKLSYSRLIAVASETCYSYLFALSRTESSFFLGYRISKWKEKNRLCPQRQR